MRMQAQTNDSIGSATMTDDGTLILDLRAEDPDGTVGHARFVYGKDDSDYADVLKHLGPMQPGDTCSVPPWP